MEALVELWLADALQEVAAASARRGQHPSQERGLLIWGGPGTGKTYLLRKWLALHACSPRATMSLVLCGLELIALGDDALAHVCKLRNVAQQSGDLCHIFFALDGADLLSRCERADEITLQIIALIDLAHVTSAATACQPSRVCLPLRRALRLDRTLRISFPRDKQRENAFRWWLDKWARAAAPCTCDEHPGGTCQNMPVLRGVAQRAAHKTVGYGCRDLCRLIFRLECALADETLSCSTFLTSLGAVLEAELDLVVPESIHNVRALGNLVLSDDEAVPRSYAGNSGAANKWGRVAGYHDVKHRIEMITEWPQTHEDTFKRLSIAAPTGMLLVGPAGCGKTLIARTLGARLQRAHFIEIMAPMLLSQYLGDSERRVRALFESLESLSPVVLLVDDIDVLASRNARGDDADADLVIQRILGSLLTELDGISSKRDAGFASNIFFLACAQNEQDVDPALIRAGRVDTVVQIGLPSQSDRREILLAATSAYSEGFSVHELSEAVVSKFVCCTEGMSCAALDRLVRESVHLARSEGTPLEKVYEKECEERERQDSTLDLSEHIASCLDSQQQRSDASPHPIPKGR
ncbi:Cell division control protein 48-like D [Porphyridium purpureum]|uniref:Cell division control protein 48-like D n=1 Tax=Porphyridium purpureum TaxID=35688 RepID=A0A5J4YY51_PORPP|nr:Cell division control protein 48-like D [Porphyridium purpureum]|eukprot:POR4805..scf208_2